MRPHLIEEPFRGGYIAKCGRQIYDPDRESVGSLDDPNLCRHCLLAKNSKSYTMRSDQESIRNSIRWKLEKLTKLRRTGDAGEWLCDEIRELVLRFGRTVSFHSTVAVYHSDQTVSFQF